LVVGTNSFAGQSDDVLAALDNRGSIGDPVVRDRVNQPVEGLVVNSDGMRWHGKKQRDCFKISAARA
jgi:hypothetical protein